MSPDLALGRVVTQLRLAGHDFEAISLALANGAVEALIAAGYRGPALDGGLLRVVEAMWDHVGELQRAATTVAPPRLIEPSHVGPGKVVDITPALSGLREPQS